MTLTEQIQSALQSVVANGESKSIQVNNDYGLWIKLSNDELIIYHIDCQTDTIFDKQSASKVRGSYNIEGLSTYIVSCVESNLSLGALPYCEVN